MTRCHMTSSHIGGFIMKFVKINNFWWNLEGNFLYNIAGGRQMAEWHKPFNEIVIEDDWIDLDWKDTVIHNNNFKTGWINRNGLFFGCDYETHSIQAEFVHKKSERELELLGWIKIYKSMFFTSKNKNGLDFIIIKYNINILQKDALGRLGFTDEEICYKGLF